MNERIRPKSNFPFQPQKVRVVVPTRFSQRLARYVRCACYAGMLATWWASRSSELRKRVESLQDLNSQSVALCGKLVSDVATLKAHNEQLRKENRSLKSELDDLAANDNKNVRVAEENYADASRELRDTLSQKYALEEKLRKEKENYSRTSLQLREALKRVEALESEKTELERALAPVQDTVGRNGSSEKVITERPSSNKNTEECLSINGQEVLNDDPVFLKSKSDSAKTEEKDEKSASKEQLEKSSFSTVEREEMPITVQGTVDGLQLQARDVTLQGKTLEKVPQPSASKGVVITLPSFTPHHHWIDSALSYLRRNMNHTKYLDLVHQWELYEKGQTQKDRGFSKKLRPVEIGTWLGSTKKLQARQWFIESAAENPQLSDDFATRTWTWWLDLQPPWRRSVQCPDTARERPMFVDVSSLGHCWKKMCVRGLHGWVMLLVCAKWWGQTLDTAQSIEKEHWIEFLDDLALVLTGASSIGTAI